MTPHDLQMRGSPVLADADVWRLAPHVNNDTSWSGSSMPIVLHMLFAGGTVTIELQAAEPRWLSETLNRLFPLGMLRENWDSYGGRPTDIFAVEAGLNLLARILSEDAPAPSVVPMSNGGVQFEWHRSGVNFEVAVDPERTVSASFEDFSSGDEWDLEVVTDIRELSQAAQLL